MSGGRFAAVGIKAGLLAAFRVGLGHGSPWV